MRGMNILKFEKFDHDFLFPFSNGQHFDPPAPYRTKSATTSRARTLTDPLDIKSNIFVCLH